MHSKLLRWIIFCSCRKERMFVDKIAKKVGEEAVELVIAAKNNDKAEVVDEASDFLYHMMVLLGAKGVNLSEVCAELCKRNR